MAGIEVILEIRSILLGVQDGISRAIEKTESFVNVDERPISEDRKPPIQLPDDTSQMSRLEWVAAFKTVLGNIESDKKLVNRRGYLVELRTIIDRAIRDLDAIASPDPE